ncbi:MAG TPA: hypothetical protein VHC95_09170, partial [Opitutales bacterium]|nr:hypothetical protein [Opitutales bacterium]
MKTPALAVLFLAVLMTGVLGADAPAPAVPAAPTPAAPIAPAAPTEPAKPPPNFVLVINVTPPGPGKAGDNLHFEIGVASRTGKFPADAVGTL